MFDPISYGKALKNSAQLEELTSQGLITARLPISQDDYDALVLAGTTVATTEYVILPDEYFE